LKGCMQIDATVSAEVPTLCTMKPMRSADVAIRNDKPRGRTTKPSEPVVRRMNPDEACDVYCDS
jgi:hypothetical protein